MQKVLRSNQGKLNKFNWLNLIFCLWAVLITYSAVSYTYEFQSQTFHCYGEKYVTITSH